MTDLDTCYRRPPRFPVVPGVRAAGDRDGHPGARDSSGPSYIRRIVAFLSGAIAGGAV